MAQKSIKVGELEIPADYWTLSPDIKRELCLTIVDAIITVLDQQISPKLNRMEVFQNLIDSSLQSNQQDENYEVCQVLIDIKQLINE
jgi:malate synthase